jgi:hypothetical protein
MAQQSHNLTRNLLINLLLIFTKIHESDLLEKEKRGWTTNKFFFELSLSSFLVFSIILFVPMYVEASLFSTFSKTHVERW